MTGRDIRVAVCASLATVFLSLAIRGGVREAQAVPVTRQDAREIHRYTDAQAGVVCYWTDWGRGYGMQTELKGAAISCVKVTPLAFQSLKP